VTAPTEDASLHPPAAKAKHGATLTAGVVAATLLVVLWVALTSATGKTYHLAPTLVAAAPGLALYMSDQATGRKLAALAGLLGAIVVAVGWTAIRSAGIEPDATLIAAQPGGVAAEVALGALGGSAAGGLLAGRAR
jgi:hypothetical protein